MGTAKQEINSGTAQSAKSVEYRALVDQAALVCSAPISRHRPPSDSGDDYQAEARDLAGQRSDWGPLSPIAAAKNLRAALSSADNSSLMALFLVAVKLSQGVLYDTAHRTPYDVGPPMDAFSHDPLSFQGNEQYDNVPEGEQFKPFCPSMVAFSHDPP